MQINDALQYVNLGDINIAQLSVESVHIIRETDKENPILFSDEPVDPDTSLLDVEMCHGILSDRGESGPDPDLWAMDEGALVKMAEEQNVGLPPWDINEEELRLIIARAISEGSLPGLDAWQSAVRESDQRSPQEFSPMANGYYPLPETCTLTPSVIQARLRDVSVCAVVKEGRVLISPTGAGGDFYFSICEAFVRLGYLPPFQVIERAFGPHMDVPTPVLQACVRTVEVYAHSCSKLAAWLAALEAPSADKQGLCL